MSGAGREQRNMSEPTAWVGPRGGQVAHHNFVSADFRREEADYYCSASGWYQRITQFFHWNSLLLLFLYLFLCRERKKVFSISLFCSALFISLTIFGTLLGNLFYSSSVLLEGPDQCQVERNCHPSSDERAPDWGVLVLTSTRIVTSESHFSHET